VLLFGRVIYCESWDCSLLGYSTAYIGNLLPTFWRSMQPLSSG
jgi:hypothetical protein